MFTSSPVSSSTTGTVSETLIATIACLPCAPSVSPAPIHGPNMYRRARQYNPGCVGAVAFPTCSPTTSAVLLLLSYAPPTTVSFEGGAFAVALSSCSASDEAECVARKGIMLGRRLRTPHRKGSPSSPETGFTFQYFAYRSGLGFHPKGGLAQWERNVNGRMFFTDDTPAVVASSVFPTQANICSMSTSFFGGESWNMLRATKLLLDTVFPFSLCERDGHDAFAGGRGA